MLNQAENKLAEAITPESMEAALKARGWERHTHLEGSNIWGWRHPTLKESGTVWEWAGAPSRLRLQPGFAVDEFARAHELTRHDAIRELAGTAKRWWVLRSEVAWATGPDPIEDLFFGTRDEAKAEALKLPRDFGQVNLTVEPIASPEEAA